MSCKKCGNKRESIDLCGNCYKDKMEELKKEVEELITMVICGPFEPLDWVVEQCEKVKKLIK